MFAVKDGCRLMIYSSETALPNNLVFQYLQENPLTNVIEYHYRVSNTEELYVFFKPITIHHNKTPKMKHRSRSVLPPSPRRNISMKKDDIIDKDYAYEIFEDVKEIFIP